MPNNMIVRIVADASNFLKELKKAGRQAGNVGTQIKKSMSLDDAESAKARLAEIKASYRSINDVAQELDLSTPLSKQLNAALRAVDQSEAKIAAIGAKIRKTSQMPVANTELAQEKRAFKVALLEDDFQAELEKLEEAKTRLEQLRTAQEALGDSNWELASSAGISALQQEYSQLQAALSEAGVRVGDIGDEAEDASSDLTALQRAAIRVKESLASAGQAAKSGLQWLGSLPKKLASGAWNGLKSLGSHLKNIGNHATGSSHGISKMLSSIKQVSVASFAFRLAGAAVGKLKSIVSEYINENEALKAQTDALKSSMGQALAPAINLVVNAMSALMPYVVGISNAIGSLMGALVGDGWSVAAAGAKKTAAATSGAAAAQKEMSKQLMGFDQINRMDSQSDTSSGSSGSAASTATIDPKNLGWLDTYKQAFTDTFTSLEFQAANVGGKIGMTLNTAITTTLGLIGDFSFETVGETLAENFNSCVSTIDWSAAGQLVGRAMLMVPQTVVGFIQQTDWALVGSALSDFIISAASSVSQWIVSTDWIGLGESLLNLCTSIDWAGITQSLGYSLGTAIGAVAGLLWGFIKEPWDAFVETCKQNAKENGGSMILGILQGIIDGLVGIGTWLWNNLAKPIINGVKDAFGIHSPSTVFAEFGQYLMQGLTNGISNGLAWVQEKLQSLKDKVLGIAENLKSAFSFEWSMPNLKLPHLSIEWDAVDNVVAKFFGVTAIPRLSVSWFAKGGILDGAQIFGSLGSTLLGGGEAGREAILPLDSNTGWMDDLARKVASSISTDGGTVSAVINIMLDGKKISSYVIKDLRSRSRAGTVCLG